MLRHLYVCRKDRDKQRDKTRGGESPGVGNQHADSAEDLADAADLDEQSRRGKPRRNDPRVNAGMHEVIDAGRHEEDR